MTLVNSSGTLIGKIEAGTETYIHNAGFVWLLFWFLSHLPDGSG